MGSEMCIRDRPVSDRYHNPILGQIFKRITQSQDSDLPWASLRDRIISDTYPLDLAARTIGIATADLADLWPETEAAESEQRFSEAVLWELLVNKSLANLDQTPFEPRKGELEDSLAESVRQAIAAEPTNSQINVLQASMLLMAAESSDDIRIGMKKHFFERQLDLAWTLEDHIFTQIEPPVRGRILAAAQILVAISHGTRVLAVKNPLMHSMLEIPGDVSIVLDGLCRAVLEQTGSAPN